MNTTNTLVILALAFVATTSAYAAETPSIGFLYNTTEESSITYNCTPTAANFLECDFVQVSVRKNAKTEDLDKSLLQATKDFPAILKQLSSDERQCGFIKTMLDVLEGKQTPEEAAENVPKEAISDKVNFVHGIKEMSESKKADFLANTRAVTDFCLTRSEENYLKITRLEHDKNTHTCRVSANHFKQKFKLVQDDASGAGSWVVDSTPEGACGIVQLSRVEADQTDSKIARWTYIAKKAITNPKGSWWPNVSCGDLDQSEYVYDWKSEREYKLGCEYIEFSPL